MAKFIDAAFSYLQPDPDRAVFIKNNSYGGNAIYRGFNWTTGTLDDGGSFPLFLWRLPEGVDNGIDATLNGSAGFSNCIYFFKAR